MVRACTVVQLCLTLWNPRDYSLPGSSVHGIFMAKNSEVGCIFFSRDLPDPGIKPASPALVGRLFTTEPSGKPV